MSLSKVLGQFQQLGSREFGTLGHPDGTLEVAGRPGWYYVTLPKGSTGDVDVGQFPGSPGLAKGATIAVVRDPYTGQRVISQSGGGGASVVGGVIPSPGSQVGLHAPTHLRDATDPVFIYYDQTLDFRTVPSTATPLSVYVYGGNVAVSGAKITVVGQTIDLTSLKPGSATDARYILIYLDAAGTAHAATGGTVRANRSLLVLATDCPALPANCFASAAVILSADVATLSDTLPRRDIIDLRYPSPLQLPTYARGAIIRGGATNWEAYGLAGSAGSFLRRDATDVLWSTLTLPNAAAVGDILYASGANAIGNLVDVAAGQPLLSGGVATAPAYAGWTLVGTAGQTYTFGTTGGTIPTAAGTLSVSTTNNISAAGVITHAITSSSNPGTAASLLASDASGQLTLVNLLANTTTFNLVNTTATTVNFAGAATAINIGTGGTSTITLGGVARIHNAAGFNAIFDASGIGGADKTYVFPNDNGIFVLGGGTADTLAYWSTTHDVASIANGPGYLTNNGAGVFSWSATASASLTATRVGFGSAGNLLTGSADFTYNDTTKVVFVNGALNLGATSNQIVMQSAGITGTLTWTPTTLAKIVTFPDATGTAVLRSGAGNAYELAIWYSPNGIQALGGSGTTNNVLISQGAGVTPAWSGFLFTGTLGGTTNFAVTSGKTLTLTATDTFGLTLAGTCTLTGGGASSNLSLPNAAVSITGGGTLAMTAAKTYTFPTADATLAQLGSNAFTATQSITALDANNGILKLVPTGGDYAGLTLWSAAGNANSRQWQISSNYSTYGTLDILRSTTNTGNPTTEVAYFDKDGSFVVGAASGGGKGAGTANFAADIYKNNVAYTSPAYALEKWATGVIVAHADKPGAATYRQTTLEEAERYMRDNFELPGHRADFGLFGGSEWLLEKLEEAYIYIIELGHRVERLETR